MSLKSTVFALLVSLGKSSIDCVGCGSNVVDRFFRVRAIPKVGEKGFFASPTKILEDSIVGGVTLNHLAWASALGVPCGLLALQGDDDAGRLVRNAMDQLGVSTSCVEVDPSFTTAESYVLSQPSDGERSILMASGSTSLIDAQVMQRLWLAACAADSNLDEDGNGVDAGQQQGGGALEASTPRVVTTEVSQVPLAGVEALLDLGNACGAVTVLDVDVSPEVCVNQARLGSVEELVRCVCKARVLKPTRHAAVDLLALLEAREGHEEEAPAGECAAALRAAAKARAEAMAPCELAAALRNASGAELVALTAGAGGCALASEQHAVFRPSVKLPPRNDGSSGAVDVTGAGDAFLGGLLAGLYQRVALGEGARGGHGVVPQDEQGLVELAALANAAGAACCETLGGLPTEGALGRVLSLKGGGGGSGGGGGGGFEEGAEGYDQDEEEQEEEQEQAREVLAVFRKSLAMDAATLAHLAGSFEDDEDGDGDDDSRKLFPALATLSVSAVVDGLAECEGRVHVTGIGKAGIVGRRLAASLASTGTPAHFTHASEWAHGDLGNALPPRRSGGALNGGDDDDDGDGGCVRGGDVVVALSHSGCTAEVVGAVTRLARRGLPIYAITSSAPLEPPSPSSSSSSSSSTTSTSTSSSALLSAQVSQLLSLATGGALTYDLPAGVSEPFGGAPTCSVVAMEALSNALVCAVARKRRFSRALFKRNHPGGALGQTL